MEARSEDISQRSQTEVLRRLCDVIGHDLNNLLGIISNNTYLLQRQSPAAPLQATTEATLKAVKAATLLTRHLQRLARRPQRQAQMLDLSSVLVDAAPLLQTVLGKRSELRVSVDAATAAVSVDPDELELALINLAFNARQAHAREVRLRARNADTGMLVLLTFGDDGRGLDDALLAKVLEPGVTAHDAATASGLGLSQVREFCERSGGRASIASTRGLGTTVSLWLPAAA